MNNIYYDITLYNNYKLTRSGQTYIDTYDTIVEKYISLKFEVNISNEHNQHIVNTLIFENGKLIKNETINILEEFYKKHNKEHVFNQINEYMNT
jgi:hypothetical protein